MVGRTAGRRSGLDRDRHLKLLGGSFLACSRSPAGMAPGLAASPSEMYRVAFGYVVHRRRRRWR